MTSLRNINSSSTFFGIGTNSLAYILGEVIAKASLFLLLPVYTKNLSPAEYGSFGISMSIIALFNVLFPLQLSVAVTVNYFGIDDDLIRKKFISTIWYSITLSSFAMFTLLYLSKEYLKIFFPDITEELLMLAGGVSLLSTFSVVPQTLMRIRKQAIRSSLLSASLYLLGVFLGLFFLLRFESGVRGILKGMLVGGTVSMLIYVWVARNDLGLYFTGSFFKSSLLLALPVLPHMLAHWGLNLMDRFVLQIFVPLSDVGIYQLGYQIGSLLQIILIAINGAWAPYFLENFSKAEKARELKTISTWLVFIQVWIALFIVLFASFFLKFVIPVSYFASLDVFPWIVTGFVFVGFYHFWVNIIFFYKRTTFVLFVTTTAFIVNLILNFVFIPRYGYISSAISTMVSYIVLAFMAYLVANRITRFDFEYWRWLKSVLAALILYGLVELIMGFVNTSIYLVVGILALLSYPVVLWCIRFYTADEKKQMGRFMETIFR